MANYQMVHVYGRRLANDSVVDDLGEYSTVNMAWIEDGPAGLQRMVLIGFPGGKTILTEHVRTMDGVRKWCRGTTFYSSIEITTAPLQH